MSVRLVELKPTVFFVEKHNRLLQKASLTVESDAGADGVCVKATTGDGQSAVTDIGIIESGSHAFDIYVPDIAGPTALECVLLDRGGQPLGSIAADWQPQRKWEVCFVPITHHDLGYTDPIEELLPMYDAYYDDVVRYCDETRDWPEEAKYRYTVETVWSLQHYIEHRPPETVERFMRYVREGRIEVSALFANVIDALCGHEQLNRLLYPAFKLKRDYGIPIDSASIVDIPGLSWALSSALAGAGIKYLFAGLPSYFEWEGRDVHNFWDEKTMMPHGRPGAFRWQGPDGASVLTYYSGGYGWFQGSLPASTMIPKTVRDVADNIERHLRNMERNGSPFSVVRYIDHGADNYPPQPGISRVVREWNDMYAYPKLIVSTNRMFFDKLAEQAAGAPVFRGEMPHTDYALSATSAAKETAINRVTHNVLVTAENLSVLNAFLTNQAYPLEKIQGIYRDTLLYDEHCFGMWQPIGNIMDWNWSSKSHYAYRAAAQAQSLATRSAAHMAGKIKFREDGPHIAVFNSLSYARTDVVKLHNFDGGATPFELIDEQTGHTVACQIVELDSHDRPVAYAAHRYALGQISKEITGAPLRNMLYTLVFVAEDVPALGYKTYRLRPVAHTEPVPATAAGADVAAAGAGAGGTVAAAADADIAAAVPAAAATDAAAGLPQNYSLENQFYKVTLDPATGAIAGIYDKEARRELIDRDAAHQGNQLVIRRIRDGRTETAAASAVVVGASGPVCQSLISYGQAAGCPRLVQEVTLYHNIKRIDIANRLLKDTTPFQELYFAFPFQVDNPSFRFEGTNSVIRPFADQLPGSNTNYYTVQHWAEVANEDTSVVLAPIEAHTLEFGGIWPSYVSHAHHGIAPVDYGREFVSEQEVTKGHMYSFVINGNYRTNFSPVQSCDVLFRYSITSGRSQLPHAFGWSAAHPLMPVYSDRPAAGVLNDTFSFCRVGPNNVLLSVLKQAEDGDGLIVRLMEMSGQSCTASVQLPFPAGRAFLTNIAEENVQSLSIENQMLRVPVDAYGIVTARVEWGDADRRNEKVFSQRLRNNAASFIG